MHIGTRIYQLIDVDSPDVYLQPDAVTYEMRAIYNEKQIEIGWVYVGHSEELAKALKICLNANDELHAQQVKNAHDGAHAESDERTAFSPAVATQKHDADKRHQQLVESRKIDQKHTRMTQAYARTTLEAIHHFWHQDNGRWPLSPYVQIGPGNEDIINMVENSLNGVHDCEKNAVREAGRWDLAPRCGICKRSLPRKEQA